MSLAERVARGVELLDRVRPGWAKEVDLDRLDVGRCDRCVLGQVFGSYGTGLVIAFPNLTAGESVAHGFFDTYPDVLTEVWRRVIAERQAVLG